MKKHKSFILILILILIFVLFILNCFNSYAFNKNENYYFYSESCLSCKEVKPYINRKNNLNEIMISNDNIISIKDFLKNEYQINDLKLPTLIYDNNIYQGKNEILKLLNKDYSYVFLFGFIDGLNPCAISILLIFLSFLIVSDKKNKLFIIGMFFILGQVLTNFLLGLGILKFSMFSKSFNNLFNIIKYISIIICIYVFILNLIDILSIPLKKQKNLNKLPYFIRFKILDIIKNNINSYYLFFISFFMGLIIGFLEFGCTGQVYIPTIITLDSEKNLLYLIYYNIMFSLPLFIFFILSLFINPDFIKEKLSKYTYVLKIFMNIILILLFIKIIKLY